MDKNNGSFKIIGATEPSLEGEISISGAKNAAIKVMAATLLFEDKVRLANIPLIEDLFTISEIMKAIGVSVSFPKEHEAELFCGDISSEIPKELAEKTRSSMVVTAPLLARTGRVVFGNPGGCDLGERPIDLWIEGYMKMGATVSEENGLFKVEAKGGKLRGAEIFFRVQSHTVTESFIMAAVLAEGKTVLKNCALEPEIKSLSDFLNSCGAKITGAGTHTIVIEGGGLLNARGATYETLPDRLEAGSFLVLGALAAKKLLISKCIPEHLEIVIEILRRVGADIETSADGIVVRGGRPLSAVPIRTHEYPGLATDLQAPMAVLLTQAKGQSSVLETIYERRLEYVPELQKMGARITLQDSHRAIIEGPSKLSGSEVSAIDIRAGMALVIAGAIADGQTTVHNCYMIDRGYERLEEKLKGIGLDIRRNSSL
ncbi:MAG: UDP-N-acetylglucosamine 1-carboxyvinyltransferase [bacterium]|nr:UDP-N-acetylglucosamine 1-carboxyvinyltransferase [bacterium]